MESFDFLGLNIIFVGVIILLVIIYLVIMINRRRKDEFLHRK
jgi:membrane protein DedA with SNARE-associated domain